MSSCTVGAHADYADTVIAFAPHADGVAVTEAVAKHASIVRGSAVDAEAAFAVAEHAGTGSAAGVDAKAGVAFAKHAGTAGAVAVDADVAGARSVDAEATLAKSPHS